MTEHAPRHFQLRRQDNRSVNQNGQRSAWYGSIATNLHVFRCAVTERAIPSFCPSPGSELYDNQVNYLTMTGVWQLQRMQMP